MSLEEFQRIVSEGAASGAGDPRHILERVRQIRGQDEFDDDFSLLEMKFL
jgi:serine phosphatase RsbU (regulator of sigma subunit)